MGAEQRGEVAALEQLDPAVACFLERDRDVDLGRRRRVAADAGRPLDVVAQLADVARPRMLEQRRDPRRIADALGGVVELGGDRGDQQRDVVGALAQRRQRDLEDGEPVVEIGAEPAAVDVGAQVAVGRGDHANVDGDARRAADPLHGPALEHAQELRLQIEIEVADLVEEHRAAAGALERADPLAIRSGERAALMPEQLAREQRARRRGEVDDDERAVAARALLVDRRGGEILAGAGLAAQEHRDVGGRRALEHLVDAAHRERVTDERAEPVAAGQSGPERARLAGEPQHGLAQGQRCPVGERRCDHRDAIDQGAVLRPEVAHDRAARLEHDLAVKPRHRRIGEHQVGALGGPGNDALARRAKRSPGIGAADHGQIDPIDHRRDLAPAHRGGAARVVVVVVACHAVMVAASPRCSSSRNTRSSRHPECSPAKGPARRQAP